VYVLDIYAASEQPIEGVNSEALVSRITAFGHRHASYMPSMEAGIHAVAQAASAGDAIVTLGAGSVSQAGDRVLERLRQ
jgi:UDP-N-acetylmuramate--alanine ligase